MAAPGGTSNVPAPTAGNAEKLEIAKRLALRINAQKNLGAEAQVLVSFQFKVTLFYKANFSKFILNVYILLTVIQQIHCCLDTPRDVDMTACVIELCTIIYSHSKKKKRIHVL